MPQQGRTWLPMALRSAAGQPGIGSAVLAAAAIRRAALVRDCNARSAARSVFAAPAVFPACSERSGLAVPGSSSRSADASGFAPGAGGCGTGGNGSGGCTTVEVVFLRRLRRRRRRRRRRTSGVSVGGGGGGAGCGRLLAQAVSGPAPAVAGAAGAAVPNDRLAVSAASPPD